MKVINGVVMNKSECIMAAMFEAYWLCQQWNDGCQLNYIVTAIQDQTDWRFKLAF